ncbi:hypothetical protein ABIB57_000481 [Devosia sp. UYZn731]
MAAIHRKDPKPAIRELPHAASRQTSASLTCRTVSGPTDTHPNLVVPSTFSADC